MRFRFEFTESALQDLKWFRKYEQTLILDRVDVQLTYEPTANTRNRLPLEPNDLAEWELRIGNYRVFYDVDAAEAIVKVKAIGCKEHNKLFIRGTEISL